MAQHGKKRPILIGNIAGSSADRIDGMLSMLRGETKVDVITGDYLAEVTFAALALSPDAGYEASFLDAFKSALDAYLTHPNKDLKIIVNAGALAPGQLASQVQKLLETRQSTARVAYVTGDDVLDIINEVDIKPLTTATGDFPSWRRKYGNLLCANAYTGCWGVVAALKDGADIILCGRVTDATPVMGAAAWWHGWGPDSSNELAGSLVAGHLIECGCYITGGNFSGFEQIPESQFYDLSFPIAEVSCDGTSVIQKQPDQNGIVTVDTVKSQLLYELQGIYYLNPDVIADLTTVQCEQLAPNRVRVSGTKGLPGPETLKVAIMSVGGYQAELSIYAAGLAIPNKVKNFSLHTERMLDRKHLQTLQVQVFGTPKENPRNELESTVQIRIFAQAAEEKTLSFQEFLRPILSNQLQSFPGLTQNFDFRTAAPKPYCTYFPGLIPLSAVKQRVHFLQGIGQDGKIIQQYVDIPNNSTVTSVLDIPKAVDVPPTNPQKLTSFGEAVTRPLGDLVYARSGDKGANVNVGFYCPSGGDDQSKWDWLRSFLTTEKLQELLGDEKNDVSHLERCEFPGIRAVHFVIHGILGAGVSSSSKMDSLGKNLAEYMRARHIQIPTQFLDS